MRAMTRDNRGDVMDNLSGSTLDYANYTNRRHRSLGQLADQEALRPETAALVADVSLRRIFYEIKSGALRAKKAGQATLILRDDLRSWLNALPDRKIA
jgi:hypothetical protein